MEIPLKRSAQYDANVDRLGEHADTCFICGRRTAERFMVHYTTNDTLTDQEDHPDSQGGFPVGPECAKKMPAGFVTARKPENLKNE